MCNDVLTTAFGSGPNRTTRDGRTSVTEEVVDVSSGRRLSLNVDGVPQIEGAAPVGARHAGALTTFPEEPSYGHVQVEHLQGVGNGGFSGWSNGSSPHDVFTMDGPSMRAGRSTTSAVDAGIRSQRSVAQRRATDNGNGYTRK